MEAPNEPLTSGAKASSTKLAKVAAVAQSSVGRSGKSTRCPLRRANDSSETGCALAQWGSACASIFTDFTAAPAAIRDARHSPAASLFGPETRAVGRTSGAADGGGRLGGRGGSVSSARLDFVGNSAEPANSKMGKRRVRLIPRLDSCALVTEAFPALYALHYDFEGVSPEAVATQRV